jgi:hydrogenase maturation protease
VSQDSTAGGQVLVVGLGQRDRGDDAVGPAVAEKAAELLPSDVKVACDVTVACQEDPTALMDLWPGAALVVVADAIRSGQPPGTVQVLHAHDGPLPVGTGPASTHTFGLAEAIELARALDRLPSQLVIVGIEATQFRLGAPLSPPVAAAVDQAAQTIAAIITTTP